MKPPLYLIHSVHWVYASFAIDMSQVELEYGVVELKLKEAQMIIVHQEEEIIELGWFRKGHEQPE